MERKTLLYPAIAWMIAHFLTKICFPAARRVTDRFHVQKLAYEAVQNMRVKAR